MSITKNDIARRTEAVRLARVHSRISGQRGSSEGKAVLDAWARGDIDLDEARRQLRANLETNEKATIVQSEQPDATDEHEIDNWGWDPEAATILARCVTVPRSERVQGAVVTETALLDPTTAYDRVVEAEVAMEMVNRARTRVQQRIYALEKIDPVEADRLRQVGIMLYDQLRSIDPEGPSHNATIIASWKPLLQDEGMFWGALRG